MEMYKDKVALVTGGSRGIGKAIALAFAEHGADVVVNYVTNKQLANEVVDQIKALGRRGLALQADVSEVGRVEEMVHTTVEEFGRISILVNNAGNFKNSVVRKMTKETWDSVIAANLTGTFNCTKTAIGYMREQKSGRIINISSVQAQTGVIGAANYAAAKAGVIGFTKSVARELARGGITVNTIALGFINTGMLKRLSPEIQDSILQQIPMGRFGEPEEVTKLVLFLASSDASYITGQVINLNGGYFM